MDAARTESERAARADAATASLSRARVACTWIACAAPLALGWFAADGVDRFAGVSFVALCGVPWLFLAGAPRTVGRSTSFAEELAAAALVCVPLATAAGIDDAQGADRARTAALFAAVVLGGFVLADAARRAARRASSARAHAIAWSALVAAPPLVLYALEAGGGPLLGRAPAAVHALARASPVGALTEHVRDVHARGAASIGVALVLAVVASAPAWRGRRAEDA